MITLNDSKNIRDIFNGYVIKPIIVEGYSNVGFGDKPRKELIIMNYKLKNN